MPQLPESDQFHEHGSPMHSPTMLEVAVNTATADLLLSQALTMPSGIYGSLEERSSVLEPARQIGDLLKDVSMDTVVSESLRALRDGQAVAVTLTGLPVDPELPAPPLDGGLPIGKTTFVSEAIGLGIAYSLGEPSLLLGEKKEALIHQITPVPGREETQSNEGRVDLKFHQDLAAHPDFRDIPYDRFMPDWLVLTGLQTGSDTTRTFIAPLDDALEYVTDDTIRVLSEKQFLTSPPASFVKESGGVPPYLPVHSVLNEYEGHMESVFDLSSDLRPIDPKDTEAIAALAELEQAFGKVKQEVIIEPGTVVAFNNRRVVHGRSEVSVNNQASRRWIQRVYVFDMMRTVNAARFLPIALGGGLFGVVGSLASEERLWSLEKGQT